MANRADIIDLIHRLLARQRRLQHLLRLLGVAIEETLPWLNTVPTAHVLNAPTLEAQIWECIAREACFGSGELTSGTTQEVRGLCALLRPGLPSTLGDLWDVLPGEERHTVVGLRRRTWQHTVQRLHEAQGQVVPAGRWPSENDRELYLIQQNESGDLGLLPGVPPPPVLPGRAGARHRRRLRVPRPPPVVRPEVRQLNDVGDVSIGRRFRIQDGDVAPTGLVAMDVEITEQADDTGEGSDGGEEVDDVHEEEAESPESEHDPGVSDQETRANERRARSRSRDT